MTYMFNSQRIVAMIEVTSQEHFARRLQDLARFAPDMDLLVSIVSTLKDPLKDNVGDMKHTNTFANTVVMHMPSRLSRGPMLALAWRSVHLRL
jgi:hypothetical protein